MLLNTKRRLRTFLGRVLGSRLRSRFVLKLRRALWSPRLIRCWNKATSEARFLNPGRASRSSTLSVIGILVALGCPAILRDRKGSKPILVVFVEIARPLL